MNHEVVNPIVLPCLWNIGDHLTTQKHGIFLVGKPCTSFQRHFLAITNKPLLASDMDPGNLQQKGKSRFDSQNFGNHRFNSRPY